MEELLQRPKSVRMIRLLREHGSMNMREFTFYSQLSPYRAQDLREWMENLGLLVVARGEKDAPTPGNYPLEIRLTKEAEKIADTLTNVIDPLIEQAKKKAHHDKK